MRAWRSPPGRVGWGGSRRTVAQPSGTWEKVRTGWIPSWVLGRAEVLENEIDEIEGEVFGGNQGVSRRIYELSREVIRFHPATRALERLAEDEAPGLGSEWRRYLKGLGERVLRVTEQVEGFRELLSNILGVNLTMVSSGRTTRCKRSRPGLPSSWSRPSSRASTG